jgi:superfamily II DNA helicase RecQ
MSVSNNGSGSTLQSALLRSEKTMNAVFKRSPYSWQLDVLLKLQEMRDPRTDQTPPGAVLLVRPTGGGKSAVRDVNVLQTGGIALTIVSLLSLGADQTNKLQNLTSDENGIIKSICLDECRDVEDQKAISQIISSLTKDTMQTVFIFSSPQAITKSPTFQVMIENIINNQSLRLVCIDEIHLFVHFGLTFHSEFIELRPVLLFDKLCRGRRSEEGLYERTV